jgi:hypothetical protein
VTPPLIPDPGPARAMVDAVMVHGADGRPRIYVELAISPEVVAVLMENPEVRHPNVMRMMEQAARRLLKLIDLSQPAYQSWKGSSE